jgi:hypothetical protein
MIDLLEKIDLYKVLKLKEEHEQVKSAICEHVIQK